MPPFRNLPVIRQLVEGSKLADAVKANALAVFEKLGRAEAKVHGCDLDEVHFHEVGAVDSIGDIVGFCALLHQWGSPRLLASPLAVGEGFVQTEHGKIPVPAMATMELLCGVPVEMSGIAEELVTPTGAALLSTLCAEFGRHWSFTPQKVGYGLGTRVRENPPNAVRAILCEMPATLSDSVTAIETNLDDVTGQDLAYLIERCLDVGALDAIVAPTQMKKGRPGHWVQVLAPAGKVTELSQLLLRESTALGVRMYPVQRHVLTREASTRTTSLGSVRVKTNVDPDGRVRSVPEFDDVAKLAREHDLPLGEVRRRLAAELG